jgi:hypothetical protein
MPPVTAAHHGPQPEVSAVTEARTGLHASLIGQGIQSGQLVIGPLNDPIWQPLPAESANPVKVARRYVASLLAEVANHPGYVLAKRLHDKAEQVWLWCRNFDVP